ncbi:MAG: Hsp33 family molecular chaperone HslO [Clostridia bacterium]|nr:Hsp33 family molecular chaperone HslO [Clostridia bacterium]
MNKLYKTLIYDRQVSLSVLETTELVNDAIKIHNLDESSAKTLGGLLTCGAYMAGCLKSDRGAISITVKAGGDAGTASVSADKDLHVRGFIDGTCKGRLNGGYLTVVKEDGLFRPFVGASELVGDDVSQNLMQYYHMSEQVPTAIAVGVKMKDGVCVAAGGVIMQLLPGTSQENMDKAEEAMQDFVNAADVVEEYGAEGIMEKYFGGITEKQHVYISFPEYKCNCSREKMTKVLIPLGKEELYSIINDEGAVKIHCHYCNTDHIFSKEDVDEFLK